MQRTDYLRTKRFANVLGHKREHHVQYLLIGLGGFLGANARFLVSSWATRLLGASFPYGTFLANISGSLLLGVTIAVLHDRALLASPQRQFFVVGFLGAYTTFSTFAYESMQLFQNGNVLLGVLNIVGSVMVGLLAVVCGFLIGRLL